MQRTLLYIVLLVILGAGVYYFVFAERNVFARSEADFNVKDTSKVGKIFLAKSSGEQVTLVRTDSGWVLNGKYKARQSTVNGLLRTLKQQQPLYPVPETAHNSVVKSLSGNSVKVELYDLDGDEINTFYVGGAAYNYTGTYMLQEKAKKPYVVQIPNFHGFLSPVYSTDFDDWRDRSVMNLPSEQIAMVSMQYLESPEHSFTITNGETVSVKTTADTEGMDLNKDRVASYLRFFTEIYTEGYLNGIAGMDSTIASVPKFCIMEVTSKKGWKQHIEIFRMPLNKRSKNLATADEGDYDVDRFYGVINNFRDTVLLQAFTFDKFFRSGVEFFMKDQPASASMMGLPTQGQ